MTTIEDWEKQFDKEFGHWGEIWNGKRCSKDELEMKDFIHSLLLQQKKQTIKEAYTKAIDLFSAYKNEPMTGNVVILEIKGLRGDFEPESEDV